MPGLFCWRGEYPKNKMSKLDNPMAGATPDDAPKQTINEQLCDGTILIGYGRRGHGMNGKDADLDRIGQCLVTELVTEDPVGASSMRVAIEMRLYASICAPSHEGIEFCRQKELWSDDLKSFFKEYHELDIDTVNWDDWDAPPCEEAAETIVDHFREQATHIVCGMDACPHDPFAFMWNDDCWDGGTDITLHVPLSVAEYESIELLSKDWQEKPSLVAAVAEAMHKDDFKAARAAMRALESFVKRQKRSQKTLDKVAKRIAREIWDGNKGGTTERDRMKQFEEEVGLCNDMINQLECYRRGNEKNKTP